MTYEPDVRCEACGCGVAIEEVCVDLDGVEFCRDCAGELAEEVREAEVQILIAARTVARSRNLRDLKKVEDAVAHFESVGAWPDET